MASYTSPVSRWERTLSAALAVGSGLAFGLAFPPLRWHALAWISLAPLLIGLRLGSTRWAAFLVWLWCLAAAWSVGDWFPRSVANYFDQPMPVAIALFFAVFTLMAGPYYLAGALAYRALARRFVVTLPWLGAACWTVAELGRGRLFTGTAFFIGNPWGLLGYTHADVLPLAQLASVTGIYGLSFVIVAVNAGIAGILWAAWRRQDLLRATVGGLVSLVPAVFAWQLGSDMLNTAPEETTEGSVVVSIAQGNLDIGSQWRSDAYGENLDTYLRLTQAAIQREKPALMVWPEAAMTFFIEREDLYRRGIGAVLSAGNVQLLAGGPREVGEGENAYTNSVYVMEPGGELSGRYDKEYLVPFAEYFPLDIDLLRRRFGRIRDFEHGAASEPIATRAGAAGLLVCNEAMLPEAARRRVLAGAEVLVNPSNDSWIPDEKYVLQQLDFARMRAIEQRRWLIRASTAGPSAIIDPYGRPTAITEPDVKAVVVGEVWPKTELSPYGRWGDSFGAACVFLVLAGLFALSQPTPDGQ